MLLSSERSNTDRNGKRIELITNSKSKLVEKFKKPGVEEKTD